MQTFRFPHPLVLLVGFIALAMALSYVLPAGVFERRPDAVTGREVVVPGSYHQVAATPVSPLDAIVSVSIPRGLQEAASVIFFVFLTGGAFTVIDHTGALRRGVDLLGLARQATLLAYQYSAGLCKFITPTNGALMALRRAL